MANPMEEAWWAAMLGGRKTVYAGMVNWDAYSSAFRLVKPDLSDGTLASAADRLVTTSLLGDNIQSCGLLKDGAAAYAGFTRKPSSGNARPFRLCSLDLSDGTLAAIGSTVDLSSLVGDRPYGHSLLKYGATTYAAFIDNATNDFRLCSIDLTTGALTAIGEKQSPSIYSHARGCAALKSVGTVYVGIVSTNDAASPPEFRFHLFTLNLSDATLTAVGQQANIDSILGNSDASPNSRSANGCALIKDGGTVYAAFVGEIIVGGILRSRFALATVNLSTGAVSAVGQPVNIASLIGVNPSGIGLLAA